MAEPLESRKGALGFWLLSAADAMLLLPWIQQSLRIRNDSNRIAIFTSQYGITHLYYW